MQTSANPVMITVAPNGARVRSSDHPQVPTTPEAIAASVLACAQAGASIAHLHARAADESPTHDVDMFRAIVQQTRAHTDAVLQLSLGTRGFTSEQAVAPLVLKPEMVSLPLRLDGSNPEQSLNKIQAMAERVTASGAIPEMSVYDEAMLDTALLLVNSGTVKPPYCFGLILGQPDHVEAGARKLMALAARLPEGALWWCAKGGRHQLELSSLAIGLGGHIRVGFEDSFLDFDGTQAAPDNAYLVKRIAELCRALGKPIATAEQARMMLGL